MVTKSRWVVADAEVDYNSTDQLQIKIGLIFDAHFGATCMCSLNLKPASIRSSRYYPSSVLELFIIRQ